MWKRYAVVKFVVVFFVYLIGCNSVHSADYGEWKVLINLKVRYAESLRFSSQAYRIKCGIINGEKPNGNIVVAEIAKRTMPFDKKRIVIRSSMYPFGQINRTYDTIDLADILLGVSASKELKNSIMPLLKSYIEKLKDFFSERNIANLTIRDGGIAAIDGARAHIANIFSRWDNGDTPRYETVISDLKIVSGIKRMFVD